MPRTRAYEIHELGQSLWLDDISRRIIESGTLARMIEDDGVSGVTSNPLIFMKAVDGGRGYHDKLKASAEQGKSAKEIYYELTSEDIIAAADILRPVYDSSHGTDGFVSVEVLPEFAHDTDATLLEAERLYTQNGRENVMVKVPGTDEGVPAITELTARGHNVNVTLLFSAEQYAAVARAYIKGLKRRRAEGLDVSRVVSVASVYLSRTDVKVDRRIDKLLRIASDPTLKTRLRELRGTAAIAGAKAVYKTFKEIFSTPEWRELEAAGARPQRPLWASMGAKEPGEDPLMYMEGVIGRDTVSTVPEQIIALFRERGIARPTLGEGVDKAEEMLEHLRRIGVDLDLICNELQKEMLVIFEHSYDILMDTIEEWRRRYMRAPATSAGGRA